MKIIFSEATPEQWAALKKAVVSERPRKKYADAKPLPGKPMASATWTKTVALVLGLALASCAGDDAVERMNRKNALEQIQMDRRDAAAERMLYDAQAADPDTTRL